MHLAALIRDLAVILGVAGFATLVFQKIKQPVVLGYILAGVIVGPHVLKSPLVTDIPNIRVWAELGVIFLMFSLGLEFSFRKLSRVGISASITALFEVFFMMICGFVTGKALGWGATDSLFLGAIVSISSTTIIIKALDELKLKTRRFAEMIFAVLVVEDLMAILILVALSTIAVSGTLSGVDVIVSAGKLVIVVGSWFLAGYFLLPRLMRYVGRLGSDEMLTTVSIGLCLILAVVAAKLGYSVALGAFIMGSILAESTESYRIEELIRPLRDLFAAIFFVSVGMLIDPRALLTHPHWVLIISAVVILGKIVNITIGCLITGQTLRTSVQVGFGMAQIGEFSFIIAGLGQALGATSSFLYPVAVAVSVITAFTTPYLIRISHRLAVWIERRLPFRVKAGLSRYAAWSLERQADRAKRSEFFKRVFRWIMNAILVIVTFILMSELVAPWLDRLIERRALSHVAGWLLAVLVSAPFLWGMFFSFKGFSLGRDASAPRRIRGSTVLFMSRLMTVIVVGILSLKFFTARATLLVTGGLAGALFIVFRGQLGASYGWFEERFLSTFDDAAKSKKPTDVLRGLAPWDAHLVRLKVHPNADIAGRRILETDLRNRFGLSVIVIQRGLKTLVAPSSQEHIYPKDELLVLGTDEQVEGARREIEKPPGLGERFRHLSGYELKQYLVTETLEGRAIKDSGIRERCGGMVVGLERGDERMINPNATIVLKSGDVLWVVGETEKLQELK